MKKLIGFIALTALSLNAYAIPGDNGVSDGLIADGDNSLHSTAGALTTFVFDTNSSALDIIDADGLKFSAGGINLTVTSVGSITGPVIQDDPGNGGLGVDGFPHETGPFADNMGGGEILRFEFDQKIDLLQIDLNGIPGTNGHTKQASGEFGLYSDNGGGQFDAWNHDGLWPDDPLTDDFLTITWFEVRTVTVGATGRRGWHGYVDSIFVRTPEPGIAALLGLGLIGIAVARRKA